MTNILLAVILTVLSLLTVIMIIVVLSIKQYSGAINAFITPEEEGKPSPLACVSEAFADILARSVVAQAKTTFMGIQSGQARAQKAIEADIAQDMAAANPLVSGVLDQFPSLKKTLRRNPALIDMAMATLSNKLQPSTPSNGHDKVKFNL